MRRAALGVMVAIGAAAGAWAQEVRFAEATPEEDATVADAFASMLMDAELAGAMLFIGVARVDLDGDGAPELLGMLQSTAICSEQGGCPIGLFKGDDDAGWTLLATLDADMVTVERGVTRGWRDLTLRTLDGPRRMRWTGTDYAPR